MTRFLRLTGIAALSLTSLGLPAAMLATQDPQDTRPLTDRITALEEVVGAQAVELAAAQADILLLMQLADDLGAACKGLESSVDTSRKNGFEWAGPNPQSKTDLLEGLTAFAKAVRASFPKEEEAEQVAEGDGG